MMTPPPPPGKRGPPPPPGKRGPSPPGYLPPPPLFDGPRMPSPPMRPPPRPRAKLSATHESVIVPAVSITRATRAVRLRDDGPGIGIPPLGGAKSAPQVPHSVVLKRAGHCRPAASNRQRLVSRL